PFLHVPETRVHAPAAREEARAYGRALLDFWVREAGRAGVAAAPQEAEGPVADAIARAAAGLGQSAVVMGTHGRHGAPAGLLGSVAERVTHLSTRPVLLLRGDAAPEAWVVHPERLPEELPGWPPGGSFALFRRVLVAVDGEASGWAALAQGSGLTRALGARLHVLHVIESFLTVGSPRTRAADWDTVRQAVRRGGRHVLEEAQRRVPGAPLTPLLYEARGHPFGRAVAQAAGDVQADLIVVGTHNRTGFDRWLLGSVSSRVMRSTGLPVLLVPLTPHAAERPAAPLGRSGTLGG
uniref:universal stress protein n=1 Tax=Deinococcus planocerae TaxID=1737569 RepID=UPI000C7EE8A7